MGTLINNKDIRKTKRLSVEWIDSCAISGWQRGADMSDEYVESSKIVSVGFLIKDTKAFITISTSISCNGNVMDPLTIPKSCILKRKYIKHG